MPLLAKRYAEALMGISEQRDAIGSHQEALQMIDRLYRGSEEFRLFLTNPQFGVPAKKTVLGDIFKGQTDGLVLNFLMLLLEKGRIRYLPDITVEYIKLADLKRNILPLTVFSSGTLEEEQLERIKNGYRRIYNTAGVKVEIRADSTLIGGIKVQVGDRVADGSVKGMLEGLKEALLKN